jgi:hypothetical protein
MTRKYLLIFVAVVTFLFLIIFDQTQRYYVESLLVVLSPSNDDVESLRIESVNESVIFFPDDFIFSISTSAYQVEGAWNEDGKSPSTWDTFVHQHPKMISDETNADVGSNSYYLFDDDIDSLNSVGVSFLINKRKLNITCEYNFLYFSSSIIAFQSRGQEFCQMDQQLIRKESITIRR